MEEAGKINIDHRRASTNILETLAAQANEYLTAHVFPIMEPLLRATKTITVEIKDKFESGATIGEEELQLVNTKVSQLLKQAKEMWFETSRVANNEINVPPTTRLLLDIRTHRMMSSFARATDYTRRLKNYLFPEHSKTPQNLPPVLQDISFNLEDYLISVTDLQGEESAPQIPPVLPAVENFAKERGVRLREETEKFDEHIMWNSEIMREIINELVKNAIEETPSGGEIVVMLHKEGNNAVFSVSDNGHGISKENLGKIFDKGFTTKITGTGQGLALAKYYIEGVLSGKIEARSENGQGSEFRLVLPLLARTDDSD